MVTLALSQLPQGSSFYFRPFLRPQPGKTLLQQGAAFFLRAALFPARPGVQGRIRGQVIDTSAAAHIRIRRAENTAAQPAHHQGAGAHGAGFQRYIQGTIGQPPVPEGFCAVLQAEDLGMGGGIMKLLPAVMICPEQGIPVDQGGADGNLALRQSLLRFLQRDPHK